MLTPDQEDALLASLFATAEVMQQELSPTAAQLMVQDLKGFDEPVLVAALQAVRREGGRFTVAAVLKHAEAADGRPAANEAWAIALESFDESTTVLMTSEIQQAALAARPIFLAGEIVGARMAFIAAYERITDRARQQGSPLEWTLSLGHDQASRSVAIEQAAYLHRLPAPAAQALLTQHIQASPTNDGRAVAGLITGDVVEASPDVREHLAQIRTGLEQLRSDQKTERRALRQVLPDQQRADILTQRVARGERLLSRLRASRAEVDQLVADEVVEISKRAARQARERGGQP